VISDVCLNDYKFTCVEIGEAINRDHTTITHSEQENINLQYMDERRKLTEDFKAFCAVRIPVKYLRTKPRLKNSLAA